MKKLFKKDQKGFTLAELLIVVAIIAVLVAISIPIFTSQLEKSREAVDMANLRAAYAAGTAAYLENDTFTGGYYCNDGSFANANTNAIKGKGTGTDGSGGAETTVSVGGSTYTRTENVSSKYVKVTVTSGVISVAFAD